MAYPQCALNGLGGVPSVISEPWAANQRTIGGICRSTKAEYPNPKGTRRAFDRLDAATRAEIAKMTPRTAVVLPHKVTSASVGPKARKIYTNPRMMAPTAPATINVTFLIGIIPFTPGKANGAA
jgi:hypothetical protein